MYFRVYNKYAREKLIELYGFLPDGKGRLERENEVRDIPLEDIPKIAQIHGVHLAKPLPKGVNI